VMQERPEQVCAYLAVSSLFPACLTCVRVHARGVLLWCAVRFVSRVHASCPERGAGMCGKPQLALPLPTVCGHARSGPERRHSTGVLLAFPPERLLEADTLTLPCVPRIFCAPLKGGGASATGRSTLRPSRCKDEPSASALAHQACGLCTLASVHAMYALPPCHIDPEHSIGAMWTRPTSVVVLVW